MAKTFLISICVKKNWAKIRCGKLNTNNYCDDHHLAATWILIQLGKEQGINVSVGPKTESIHTQVPMLHIHMYVCMCMCNIALWRAVKM